MHMAHLHGATHGTLFFPALAILLLLPPALSNSGYSSQLCSPVALLRPTSPPAAAPFPLILSQGLLINSSAHPATA